MATFIKAGYWEKLQKGFKGWLNLDDLIQDIATPLISSLTAVINGTYSTTLQFNRDKDIYQDVTGQSPAFTLASSGNVNGIAITLRLNQPTAFSFSSDFEASEGSVDVDATKLNVITLLYFSDWDGAGTPKVIYTNTLFTAI